ncbi:MAG: hypothetical protein ACYC90_14025 [Candidatus Nanopelagicales bacterium]
MAIGTDRMAMNAVIHVALRRGLARLAAVRPTRWGSRAGRSA